MPKKTAAKRDVLLNIAMDAEETALLQKAAKIMRIPKSVWARSVILREAVQIIGEAAAATGKKG